MPPHPIDDDLVGGYSVCVLDRSVVTVYVRRTPGRRRTDQYARRLPRGAQVRVQFNQEEKWTRAFRCLLDDLKWLLEWHAAGTRP